MKKQERWKSLQQEKTHQGGTVTKMKPAMLQHSHFSIALEHCLDSDICHKLDTVTIMYQYILR